jgi:hypothetical protein
MTASVRRSCAAALIVLLSRGALAQGTRDGLAGTSRGTSLCLNRQALPACSDEQVVYDIAAPPGRPDAIIVKADKIVDGRRVPMGELVFRSDAAAGRWVTEIETPNVHALWYLSLHDGVLSGGMTLLPSSTLVRAIELRRIQGSV